MSTSVIFDFKIDTDVQNWRVVDDVVMGGRSYGTFSINNDGHGVFEGTVSLENYGGFSSVRHRTPNISTEDKRQIVLHLKGDGKPYQLRIKANYRDYFSYAAKFETTGEWEEIAIPLKDMYPTFRGRRLGIPNFDRPSITEIAILIGNKKNEQFKLLLDRIELQ